MLQKVMEKIQSVNLKIVAFVLGIVIGLIIGNYDPPPNQYNYEEVIVKPGDTLWNLIKTRSGNEYHIQELIHATNIANGIKGNITPGQHIKIAVSIKK